MRTVGIAWLEIDSVLRISNYIVTGAIVSRAYFGDKLSTLGVHPFTYAPYAFLNLINPVIYFINQKTAIWPMSLS